ncbi:MAG: hypothetical protein HY056_07025 [Proteobacteria bacterium]|nr:hypothetical protein [Pseudomonadota bacterium]
MRDFYVVVAGDCVAAPDDLADLHASSLASIRHHLSFVKLAKDFASAWELPLLTPGGR